MQFWFEGQSLLERHAATQIPLTQATSVPRSFVTQSLLEEQERQMPSFMQFWPEEQSVLEEQAAMQIPLTQATSVPLGGGPSFVTQSLLVVQDLQAPSLMQF